MRAVGGPDVLRWGLLATEDTDGGNPLDRALWASPAVAGERAAVAGYTRVAVRPFDHDRRMVSVLVRDLRGRQTLVTMGATETVLDRCVDVPEASRAALAAEFAAGNRVVAVATRAFADTGPPTAADERDLHLEGLLVFLDPPRADAAAALNRLAALGMAVKVVMGNNAAVAVTVCGELGLSDVVALTGADLDGLDDTALAAAIPHTTVFARVSPEHKAAARRTGTLRFRSSAAIPASRWCSPRSVSSRSGPCCPPRRTPTRWVPGAPG
jgi:Mg2+-importing ATPase